MTLVIWPGMNSKLMQFWPSLRNIAGQSGFNPANIYAPIFQKNMHFKSYLIGANWTKRCKLLKQSKKKIL